MSVPRSPTVRAARPHRQHSRVLSPRRARHKCHRITGNTIKLVAHIQAYPEIHEKIRQTKMVSSVLFLSCNDLTRFFVLYFFCYRILEVYLCSGPGLSKLFFVRTNTEWLGGDWLANDRFFPWFFKMRSGILIVRYKKWCFFCTANAIFWRFRWRKIRQTERS